jgi:hypothetical protein
MVQAMIKDVHWVKAINATTITRFKKPENIRKICQRYVEICQQLQPVLEHGNTEKCRCRAIILQSKHAWIVHDEVQYRDILDRALFQDKPAYPDAQCWLHEKLAFYNSGAAAFDTPHLRQRYEDIVILTDEGHHRNAAALYLYTISSIAEKITAKYPALHHKDDTCDCETYFKQAPRSKTVRKMFELEKAINTLLKHKDLKRNYKHKCWTARTIFKYKKYVNQYS